MYIEISIVSGNGIVISFNNNFRAKVFNISSTVLACMMYVRSIMKHFTNKIMISSNNISLPH